MSKHRNPIVSTWVFRLEVASDKTPWTKEILKELKELLYQAKLFGNFYIEEDLGGCAVHILPKKVQKA
jgi:hypothetical protein